MAARRRKIRTVDKLRVTPATGEVCERGKRAHGNTANGLVYADPAAITTLIPIGYFTEDVTGDGTITTLVELFEEVRLDGWVNDDAPNDVQSSDVFTEVYLKDEVTVTTDATGHSKAGRVFMIDEDSGLVYLQQGLAVSGPTGANVGTSESSGVADKTALAAIAAASRHNGMLVLVHADNSLWRFDSASTLSSDEALELAIEPAVGTGCWIAADKHKVLKLPFAFGLADHATLLTVPVGFALRLTGLPFYDNTVAWAGGTSSAIGIASSVTGYTAAGDILGGAAGDVEAGLGAGIKPGTVGAKVDTEAERQALIFVAGDTLTYEEITSAFTAGAGFVCVPVAIMKPAA